ncbi:MAG: hypothetical protein WAV89_08795 [Ignavibacteriaceae bacterium]
MQIQNKYTIENVLNLENGEIIYAKDFFKKSFDEIISLISELQRAIWGYRDSLYVCYYCKQKIIIRVSIKRELSTTLYFKNLSINTTTGAHYYTDDIYNGTIVWLRVN